MRIVTDVESRCDISVVDVGPSKYAAHPSNELLCVGWQVDDSPAKAAILCGGSDGRAAVERRVREAGRVVATRDEFVYDFNRANVRVAHNHAFEVAEFERHFPFLHAREREWSCTAARARRLGLPGSLKDACAVLRTPHQKSEEGHGIMLQVSQPRPVRRANPGLQKFFEDADRLARTAVYCLDDVEAEGDLDRYLPELPPQERLYWQQTERCNVRGIRLDVALIDKMAAVVERSAAAILGEVRMVTGDPNFEVTNVEQIKRFCADRGLFLDDLRASTVEAKLAAHRSGQRRLDDAVATVLEARQQSGGKSSTAKLAKMRECVMNDGRVRDNVMYHGAHTGRTTGGRD